MDIGFYSKVTGNFIPSQSTGQICCNASTMAAVGMPPHPYQYIRSCCSVQVDNIRRESDLLRMRRRDLRRAY